MEYIICAARNIWWNLKETREWMTVKGDSGEYGELFI